MPFEVEFPTRHTDTFGATPFVHAGVLLALTELAYARIEAHLGISKPANIVAVERETRAVYYRPLHWEEGAVVEAKLLDVGARGFTIEFEVRSHASGARIASFVHGWVWLDSDSGRRVDIPEETQARFREL
jgi:acyl-CoA thioesterase FadM